MRLIDADELLKTLNAKGIPFNADINDAIDNAPTVEPKRKTGKWILHENQRQEDIDNDNYLYVCSECGKSDIHAKTQEVPFCWWCGSEMRDE